MFSSIGTNEKKALSEQIRDMVKILHKQTIKKDKETISLGSLPWCLIVGPNGSGKTTLISNSEQKFILEKKQQSSNAPISVLSKNEEITSSFNLKGNGYSSKQYDFWANKNVVFIDTPDYFFDERSNLTSLFLNMAKQYTEIHSISSIVIVISIQDIFDNKKRKIIQDNLKNFFDHVKKIFNKNITTYLVISKCDLITGFREFFSDLSSDERKQQFGFELGEHCDEIEKIFDVKYDMMLERVNAQLVWRLQHAHDLRKRSLINDFPLQMKELKPHIKSFLGECIDVAPFIDFSGIFFTSVAVAEISSSHQMIQKENVDESFYFGSLFGLHAKSYFISKFFSEVISKKTHIPKKIPFCNVKYIVYLTTVLLFVIFSLTGSYLYNYYKKEQSDIYRAKEAVYIYKKLVESKQAENIPVQDKLKALNELKLIAKQSTAKSNLKHFTSRIYFSSLRQLIFPQVTSDLVRVISDKEAPPDLLYRALKCYMMLGDISIFNADEAKDAVLESWQYLYKSQVPGAYLSNLDIFFRRFKKPIVTNYDLIHSAQKRLSHYKQDDLAYIILLSKAPPKQQLSLNLKQNKMAASILTFADKSTISSLYTSQTFNILHGNAIDVTADEIVRGNYVLGKEKSISTKDFNKQKQILKNSLYERYANDYVNAWTDFLNTVQVVNYTDFSALNYALWVLGDPNRSPIKQLIGIVGQNIPQPIADRDNNLKQLKKLSESQDKLMFITNVFNEVFQFLSPITGANKSPESIFNMAVKRMQSGGKNDELDQLLSLSQSYPAPIDRWIKTIGMNVWQLMLIDSVNYINKTWQSTALLDYQSQCADKFPINPGTTNQMSLKMFSNYFGPNGIFEGFFKTYLSPFIDDSEMPWKIINVDNATLPISQDTMRFFESLRTIQTLYYDSKTKDMAVYFTLQPVAFSQNLYAVSFQLGDQFCTFSKLSPNKLCTFTWPDQINSNLLLITLTDTKGNRSFSKEIGPWSLIKLFSHTERTSDIGKLQVSISKDNLTANLLLITERNNDPFTFDVFRNIKFPQQL